MCRESCWVTTGGVLGSDSAGGQEGLSGLPLHTELW